MTRLSSVISIGGVISCLMLYVSEERKERRNLSLSVRERNDVQIG